MKRCLLLALLLVALGVAGVRAQEKMTPPSSPPPVFALASAREKDETVQLELTSPTFVPRTVEVTVERDGKLFKETRTMMAQVYETRILTVDGKTVSVSGLDGKKLTNKELLNRLQKQSPVLLSPTAKVDPFYQKFLREDLLVLTAPPTKVFGGLPPPPPPVPPRPKD